MVAVGATRESLRALADRFICSTGSLPDEWQDWREEFHRDLRTLVAAITPTPGAEAVEEVSFTRKGLYDFACEVLGSQVTNYPVQQVVDDTFRLEELIRAGAGRKLCGPPRWLDDTPPPPRPTPATTAGEAVTDAMVDRMLEGVREFWRGKDVGASPADHREAARAGLIAALARPQPAGEGGAR